MNVAIIPVFTDPHRRGAHHRSALQPQIGPLIAALLPAGTDIEIINDTWTDPDWNKRYDLVFLGCMHSDFDRARHIARYFQSRGALTVLGGNMATTFPDICAPYFDAIAVGDPEDIVPIIFEDAKNGTLKKRYDSSGYHADKVPTPLVELAITQQVVPKAMEITRGCPFVCNFCALTGSGTRFKYPEVQKVMDDIDRMDAALKKNGVPAWKRKFISFYDNNMAGNMPLFKELCEALIPKKLIWGTCVTFNVLRNRDVLKLMYKSGCRSVFVGLESFNPEALNDFNKKQNRIEHIREAIDNARKEGILVTAGMMLSPIYDDAEYIRKIPKLLIESGIHIPVFVCIEAAIPGTPLFNRLASSNEPQMMPHTALHDCTGYSLVIQPKKMSAESFAGEYHRLIHSVFSPKQRIGKILDDAWYFIRKGSGNGLMSSILIALTSNTPLLPGRTNIPATDLPIGETVPLTADDFDSEAEFLEFMKPTMVTDEHGYILPKWLKGISPLQDKRYEKAVELVMV